MSSTKLLSELAAWRNFTLIEESPDRIVFELWDKANWNKIAAGMNKNSIVGNLTAILLIFGTGLFMLFVIPKPWGMVCFLTSLVLMAILGIYKVIHYKKTKYTSAPCAIFDRNTGLATGIQINFSSFDSMPWEVEIDQITSLALKWDDPRFDAAMLEVLDANGLVLCTFFGRRYDLRKNADPLGKWLNIIIHDEIQN
jgi:hypothetical protein